MNALIQILVAVLNSLWQAAIVAALVWLALKLLPRAGGDVNAATRYVIWWAALAVVMVLPAAPRIVETLRASMQTPSTATAKTVKSPAFTAPTIPETPVVITLKDEQSARWPLWILALWALLFLYRTTQIVRSYFYLRGIKRRAAVSGQPLPAITRSAMLLLSTDISSPMAVGFLRPAVILPASLPHEIEQSELEHVLLHEAAHIARNDDWTNLAARLLGALLALHPVAVWILRQVEREREMACDDWVVARTGAARPYAASLARMFELRRSRREELPNLKLAAGILGGGSHLGERIEALLKRRRDLSPRASVARVALSAAVLLIFAIGSSFVPQWVAFAHEPAQPSFDVASIKPGDPDSHQVSLGIRPGGRFITANASLQTLIGFAFNVRDHQIAGGPNWLDSARFNIEAKAPGAVPIPPGPIAAGPMRLMVESLLNDRFKLAVHRETRIEQLYELVLEKGRSKLREVPDPGPSKPNGLRMGRGELIGMAAPVSLLANQLSQRMGRSVIDKTGLAGRYDFTLKWQPDPGMRGAPAEGAEVPPPSDSDGPSIFAALKEQLGLRLQSAKGPVEILVIDHVEKPDAN